jgi:hypothetical protein
MGKRVGRGINPKYNAGEKKQKPTLGLKRKSPELEDSD